MFPARPSSDECFGGSGIWRASQQSERTRCQSGWHPRGRGCTSRGVGVGIRRVAAAKLAGLSRGAPSHTEETRDTDGRLSTQRSPEQSQSQQEKASSCFSYRKEQEHAGPLTSTHIRLLVAPTRSRKPRAANAALKRWRRRAAAPARSAAPAPPHGDLPRCRAPRGPSRRAAFGAPRVTQTRRFHVSPGPSAEGPQGTARKRLPAHLPASPCPAGLGPRQDEAPPAAVLPRDPRALPPLRGQHAELAALPRLRDGGQGRAAARAKPCVAAASALGAAGAKAETVRVRISFFLSPS